MGKSNKSSEADYSQARSNFEAARKKFVNSIKENKDLSGLQDRLYKMIDYAVKRHDWYEDQKKNLLQIAMALLSVFAAFAAVFAKLLYDHNIQGISIYFGFAFLLSGFGTALRLIYFFNSTIGMNHPYRKVVDIRSWYFRYNLSLASSAEFDKDFEKAKKQVDNIVSDFDNIVLRWLTYAGEENKFLEEDFEQVFILQLLQKYRSDQLKLMSKTLFWGVLSSVFIMVVTLVVFATAKGNVVTGTKSADAAKKDTLAAKEIYIKTKSILVESTVSYPKNIPDEKKKADNSKIKLPKTK